MDPRKLDSGGWSGDDVCVDEGTGTAVTHPTLRPRGGRAIAPQRVPKIRCMAQVRRTRPVCPVTRGTGWSEIRTHHTSASVGPSFCTPRGSKGGVRGSRNKSQRGLWESQGAPYGHHRGPAM